MKSLLRVLHLEDDPKDAELAQCALEAEGIDHIVVRVDTQPAYLTALESGGFDLILSDFSLPSFDGSSALALARARCPDVPFIFVTGTLGEELAIETLKNGATDYVLKEHLSRLAPAVRRALQEVEERAIRKRAEEQLIHNAYYDGLTGLPNRSLFMDRLQQSIALKTRHKDQLFAVLFLDLDRFKVINDSLGHSIGDQLLIAVAQRLKCILRPDDTMARFGGDELAILLEDIKDVSSAIRVSSRVHSLMASPFHIEGHEIFISASIGIAADPAHSKGAADILRDADTAMYRAKGVGFANSEVFDESMHAHAVAILALETDLRRAIDRKEFVLHYQPIVSLETGQITSVEALVRWQHAERGLVMPSDFLPLAEETGLILPICEWVLHTACEQNAAWQKAKLPPVRMAVNLSAHQFKGPNLVGAIADALDDSGLDPRWLELELTEDIVMENAGEAMTKLLELRGLGVRLSIDDFGTGYSSLSHLKRFVINTLKIDASFVRDITDDPRDSAIVVSVISLAHNLGLTVIAEGVETALQMEFLRSLHCDEIQGYYLYKPMQADELTQLLQGVGPYARMDVPRP